MEYLCLKYWYIVTSNGCLQLLPQTFPSCPSSRSGRTPRVLIGNKLDLKDKMNCVDRADVQLVTEKLGAPHVEASVKDRTNIEAALSLLVKEIRNRRCDEVVVFCRE